MFLHGVDYSALDWFLAVSDVWEGSGDDYGHCVVEVRALHFFGDFGLEYACLLRFLWDFGGFNDLFFLSHNPLILTSFDCRGNEFVVFSPYRKE